MDTQGNLLARSEHFFDPFLTFAHPGLEALIAGEAEAGERMIAGAAGRVRKRRETDREGFAIAVRLLLTNAAYVLAKRIDPPQFAIALAKPYARASRYDAPRVPQLATALSTLSQLRLITVRKSQLKGTVSAVQADWELKRGIAQLEALSVANFKSGVGETIVLRKVTRGEGGFVDREYVEYADDDRTRGYRSELKWINSALAAANLTFVSDGGSPVEIGSRSLRRIFQTGSSGLPFERGGRLYGAFWINMARERRRGICIDGVPLASVDFSSLHVRLLYARLGFEPPSGDLYAGIIPGDSEGRYREGVKAVVGAMLARTSPLSRVPRAAAELLPKGCTGRMIRAAILERHRAIAGELEVGIAPILEKTESNILIEVLLRLLDAGAIGLPLHDGVLLRQDEAERAAAVMRAVAREKTGFELPVKVARL